MRVMQQLLLVILGRFSKWAMTIARGKKNDFFYLTTDAYDFLTVAESNEDSNLLH